MKWTEENKPNYQIPYNHIVCPTPIGDITIEWKGWKERPSYDVMSDDKWLGSEYTLDNAKKLAEKYIDELIGNLVEFRKKGIQEQHLKDIIKADEKDGLYEE